MYTLKATGIYWKKLKTQTNGKISCVHESEELLLVCPYYPKSSIESMQFLPKFLSIPIKFPMK